MKTTMMTTEAMTSGTNEFEVGATMGCRGVGVLGFYWRILGMWGLEHGVIGEVDHDDRVMTLRMVDFWYWWRSWW